MHEPCGRWAVECEAGMQSTGCGTSRILVRPLLLGVAQNKKPAQLESAGSRRLERGVTCLSCHHYCRT